MRYVLWKTRFQILSYTANEHSFQHPNCPRCIGSRRIPVRNSRWNSSGKQARGVIAGYNRETLKHKEKPENPTGLDFPFTLIWVMFQQMIFHFVLYNSSVILYLVSVTTFYQIILSPTILLKTEHK